MKFSCGRAGPLANASVEVTVGDADRVSADGQPAPRPTHWRAALRGRG